jgi:hypothetical protein
LYVEKEFSLYFFSGETLLVFKIVLEEKKRLNKKGSVELFLVQKIVALQFLARNPVWTVVKTLIWSRSKSKLDFD